MDDPNNPGSGQGSNTPTGDVGGGVGANTPPTPEPTPPSDMGGGMGSTPSPSSSPAPEEKCVTCGNSASGGTCTACGQGEVSCTCQPAQGGGTPPAGEQPTGAPAV